MSRFLVAAALAWAAVGVAPAAATTADESSCIKCDRAVDVRSGNGESLRAEVRKVSSDTVPGRGNPSTHGAAPGRTTWRTVEEYVTPACTGNELHAANDLCNVAVTTCPGDDQVRYWIWHRETTHTRDVSGNVTSVTGDWQREPGSYCLGPDDPGVPTIGQVIAQVQTGFKDLPLPEAQIQVDPSPSTLVHIPTAFFAGGATTAAFNPVILGTQVHITATATEWTWNWGDGTPPQTFDTPGVPKQPVVSHTYTAPGTYTATVTATWTGTFRLAGSTETFQIRTPVPVAGTGVPVVVREARTQLVDE